MSRKAKSCAVTAFTVLVLTASAASAQAASLVLPGSGCGLSASEIPYVVGGLAPNSSFQILANGQTVGSGTANAGGAAAATFTAPSLKAAEKLFTIQISDGTNVLAAASITLTSHDLTVKPARGKPNRRVKIHLYGWLGHTVYMHFIPPQKTRASRTVKLGKTKGVCGHATVKLKHFYNTARPKAGVWGLAFDTHKRLDKTDPFLLIFSSIIRFH